MPKNETLRIYDFTTKVSPEVDADAVVVDVSKEQLEKIATACRPTPQYVVAWCSGKEPPQTITPQPTYDQILRTILTLEQYEQALKANQAGQIVKFAKAPSCELP